MKYIICLSFDKFEGKYEFWVTWNNENYAKDIQITGKKTEVLNAL